MSFLTRLKPPPAETGSLPAIVWDRAACLGAAVVAFVVYIFTLAPSVTGEDSGELIAAACTLGIPHPSGYPLWTLVGKAAIEGIPFGTVAWRVNLLSAIFAAVSVWLLAEIVLLMTARRAAAIVGALVFAFSREFWEQSVIAEIYTLNAALVLATVYLLLRWSRSNDRRPLYASALLAGLAAAHYSLSLLLLPVYAIYVFALDLSPRRLSTYVTLALLTLPGWLIYLYLPIRSVAGPAMDWGNPQTWHGFWDVVLRRQYAHLVTDRPRTWARFVAQLGVFLRLFAWQFTPWVAVAAAAGCVALWRERVSAALLLLGVFAVTTLGGILIPNFPLEDQWIWLNTPYWIPAYAAAAVFVGYALGALIDWRPWRPGLAAAAGAVLILSPFAANLAHNDRHGDYLADDYARNLLRTMAPDAVYFGSGDRTVFPVVYLQIVEGERPDVLVANRYGYADDALYQLAGEAPPRRRPGEAELQRLFDRVTAVTDRPVYSAGPRSSDTRQRVNAGLLYQYVPPVAAVSEAEVWGRYTWHKPGPEHPGSDWSQRLIAYDYASAEARRLFDEGSVSEALAALGRAAGFCGDDKEALNNLGIVAANGGQLEVACTYFERSLAQDPRFLPARTNLALCRLRQGEAETALDLVEGGLEFAPNNARLLQLKQKALAAVEDR